MANFYNDQDGAKIKGTSKADQIYNSSCNNVSISAGAGNDSVTVAGGNNVIISGGKGNDFVSIASGNQNNTVDGGAGDDTIYAYGDYDVIRYSGGNDVVYAYGGDDSIQLIKADSVDEAKVDGNDIVLTINSNTLKLIDAARQALNVIDADGNWIDVNLITNTIVNDQDGKKIKGTSKADQIYNSGGNNVSINAGAGNDSVTVEGGHNVTVSGGKGNDFVQREWGAGTVYVYTGGNDTLTNFGSHFDTSLVIAGSWSSQRSDDSTVIINVTGKGSITLEDNKVNIVSSVSKAAHYNLNWNDDSNRTFNGTSKSDYFWNGGHLVKINGNAGNDCIDNDGSNSTINGGTGDDLIYNHENGGNSTIKGGDGNDFIYNHENDSNSIIDGGDGNDFIANAAGDSVTIEGGAGNDWISNGGERVKIFGGKGSDTIKNWKEGNKVTISGGDDNDFITNYGGSNLSISGGDGDDNIENREGWYWNEQTQMNEYTVPDKATIDGGKGNDIIYNYGNKASVNGGAGNDYIYNGIWESTNTWGSKVTIDGGAGDDTISNDGAKVLIKYSGGNDLIYGFNKTSTLKISSGTLSSVTTNGYDYFVSVGKSLVTLSGAAQFGKANIVDSKGKAVKYSVDKNFVGTNKSDSFSNYLDGAKINAGKGDDYISNSGAKVSINAGSGNNRIYNFRNQHWNYETGTLETLSSPDNTTIIAGKGNDYISNDGANVLIKYSGGDDTIGGLNETSTLQISSGKISSVTTNGTDYFLKIGENTLRLNGVANLDKVNIVNSKGKAIKFTVGDVSTITNKKANRTLKGTADRDKITNSGKKVLINGAGGEDTISNSGANSTLNGDAGNDSISNDSTKVSINGGADNDYINNNGSNVTINGAAGDDTISNNGAKVTIAGGDGNEEIFNYSSKVSINAGAGNDNINNSGSNVTIQSGKGNDIFIYKPGEGTDTIFDYQSGDMLKILKSNGKAGGTFTGSSFKNGNLTLAIDGGGKVIFDGVASGDKININGTSYTISGKKLK